MAQQQGALSASQLDLVARCTAEYEDVVHLTADEWEADSVADDMWSVVDVRTSRERHVSRMPRSASKAAFEAQADLHRMRRILVVCHAGCKSARYTAALRERGFDALSLQGGLAGWVAGGHELVDDHGEPTTEVAPPGGLL
jgi:rhodanese-related sulfurtransferase